MQRWRTEPASCRSTGRFSFRFLRSMRFSFKLRGYHSRRKHSAHELPPFFIGKKAVYETIAVVQLSCHGSLHFAPHLLQISANDPGPADDIAISCLATGSAAS
jgi:hypothetical protein